MKIKEKYQTLLRKTNIDESEHQNWDSEQIVDWTLSLDESYQRYEEVLRTNLNEEEVTGDLLPQLKRDDLHRLGIKVLKRKIAIEDHIARVVSQKASKVVESAPPAYQKNDGPNCTA